MRGTPIRALCVGLLVAGCSGEPPERGGASPTARRDIVETLREDEELERHPADGGGRAWLEESDGQPPSAVAGLPGRWTVVYEAGPLGVAEGGWVFFQAPPFWNWSTPQIFDPQLPGYTEVSSEAEGVELEPATVDPKLLAIQVRGRALRQGETVRMVYGAGPAGALADRYAERRSRFYVAVDGDGDGVRALVPDVLELDVAPGPAARLVLTLPSTARPGDTVRLAVAVLDPLGNAGVESMGELLLHGSAPGLELPATLQLRASDAGVLSVEVPVLEEGIFRVKAEGPRGIRGESNPLVVSGNEERILWGDLHGHSNFSDGTGTPEDYFRYARDVAGLDVVALTDHDHWGIEALDRHPELWEEIRRETQLFHRPGRFVTLLGYEWTNWIHGHRHVLYFEDHGEVLSSIDPAYETPLQLWDALRGQAVLTFAHHSAGGPVATNWEFQPDPELEPVTEIVSVHGSSEALDSPKVIYSPVEGNFVRDVLDRGYVLGFVGSGDSHDGHPGLAGLASASGGLAAILSEELTREGVLAALRARRVYATNGPRIVLRASLAGHSMGSTLRAAELSLAPGGAPELRVQVVAPAPLERIDLIRRDERVGSTSCAGRRVCEQARPVFGLESGDYLYVRAVQEDGGAAWSSPFFIER
ncbi:MAG: CehA/McbA family metallohydrolase [Thermoanaerobaculia bacterium]